MDLFVAEQNVRRFHGLLETETDPDKRAMIERLLKAEAAKIEKIGAARETPKAARGA